MFSEVLELQTSEHVNQVQVVSAPKGIQFGSVGRGLLENRSGYIITQINPLGRTPGRENIFCFILYHLNPSGNGKLFARVG